MIGFLFKSTTSLFPYLLLSKCMQQIKGFYFTPLHICNWLFLTLSSYHTCATPRAWLRHERCLHKSGKKIKIYCNSNWWNKYFFSDPLFWHFTLNHWFTLELYVTFKHPCAMNHSIIPKLWADFCLQVDNCTLETKTDCNNWFIMLPCTLAYMLCFQSL